MFNLRELVFIALHSNPNFGSFDSMAGMTVTLRFDMFGVTNLECRVDGDVFSRLRAEFMLLGLNRPPAFNKWFRDRFVDISPPAYYGHFLSTSIQTL